MAKVTKMRFSIFDDIILLREVIKNNPYENRLKWVDIQRNIYNVTLKNFSLRTLREHVDLLLKLFIENDANLRRSGTREQYMEKEHLLGQILRLQHIKRRLLHERSRKHLNDLPPNSFLSIEHADCSSQNNDEDKSNNDDLISDEVKVEGTSITTSDEQENEQNSSNTVEDFNKKFNRTTSSPPSLQINNINETSLPYYRKRRNRLIHLREKRKRQLRMRQFELELEKRSIDVEERRVRLEEAKFRLEKFEREKRLQVEIEERRHRIEIEKQQHAINNMLIHKFINQ